MNTANLRLRGRWLLALFASLFLAVGASAQNEVEIQGRVTADGQPLVGASVIIKGTTTGTSTDIAGNFTVRAKNGAVLSVGFVGYKTREVAVTAGVTFLDIVLEAEEALIDDVVVIGYGSMKKERPDRIGRFREDGCHQGHLGPVDRGTVAGPCRRTANHEHFAGSRGGRRSAYPRQQFAQRFEHPADRSRRIPPSATPAICRRSTPRTSNRSRS